jgi:putative aminopeptidase FrvX
MNFSERLPFLKALLEASGPSGFEGRAAKVWADEAAGFSSVTTDYHGNVYASIKPASGSNGKGSSGLKVLLTGHIDEIGLIVTHIDSDGFLTLEPIGGWDAQILLGQRLRVLAKDGDLIGVLGRKPIHLLEGDDRRTAVKIEDMTLDLGFEADEVKRRVRVGDVAVLEGPVLEFGAVSEGKGRLVSKALDDRIGAFAVLEALRILAASGCVHEVIALAAVQEEIGSFGARVATFKLEPHVALVVDVTFESKQPGVPAKKVGEVPFGSGANINISPFSNPVVVRELLEVAEREGIPTTLSANGDRTFTDADATAVSRVGVPTGVISIPLRYMHSASEMVALEDVRAVVDLLVAYVSGLTTDRVFNR